MGKIKSRLRCRQAHHGQIHGTAKFQPLPHNGQQDQGDSQRIKEHQHGNAPGDDGGQSQVGNQHGSENENQGPKAIARPAGKHLGKGLGAAGDKADGRFQAGHRHNGKEEQGAAAAKIMMGNYPQDLTAIFTIAAKGRALGGDHRQEQIDEPHEEAAEKPGPDGGSRHGVSFLHPGGPDGVYHNNAESETRQGVKGIVALEEASGKSIACLEVFPRGRRCRQRRNRLEQGRGDQAEQQ